MNGDGEIPPTTSDEKSNRKNDYPASFEHAEKPKEDNRRPDVEHLGRDHLNAVFENPLAGIPREQLLKNVAEFCKKYQLEEYQETFVKGALVSQDSANAINLPELTDEEREALIREHTHKWSQPWKLYWLAGELERNKKQKLDKQETNILKPCVHLQLLYRVWMRRSTTVHRPNTPR